MEQVDSLKDQAKGLSGFQVFNFGNWAAHRSTKRYNRHIYSILGVQLFVQLSTISDTCMACIAGDLLATYTNIWSAMQSRIFRGLLGPLISVTALAVCVATYETLREVDRCMTHRPDS